MEKIIIGIVIHIIIPFLGAIYYLVLNKKMKDENISNAPKFDLLILILTYIILICISLTSIFWNWSGIASLGTFYLILFAPLLMGLIIDKNQKNISKYHKYVYLFSILYFIIAPFIIFCLYFLESN